MKLTLGPLSTNRIHAFKFRVMNMSKPRAKFQGLMIHVLSKFLKFYAHNLKDPKNGILFSTSLKV